MFTSYYSRWWKGFGLIPPSETKFDCANCSMVSPPQNETLRDPGPFNAAEKCCTYFPFIPNFSLGSHKFDRDKLLELSREGALSPLGLSPLSTSPKKCPFLKPETASCTIWSARPSVCASYHCMSNRGRSGLDYWERAEAFGNLFEWTLVHETLWSLGFSATETAEMAEAVRQDIDADDGAIQKQRILQTWAEWRGREPEFFQLCAERAREITPEQLLESLGPEGRALIEELRCANPLSL